MRETYKRVIAVISEVARHMAAAAPTCTEPVSRTDQGSVLKNMAAGNERIILQLR